MQGTNASTRLQQCAVGAVLLAVMPGDPVMPRRRRVAGDDGYKDGDALPDHFDLAAASFAVFLHSDMNFLRSLP